ncbi:MAG TPA: iron dependent repressor, metal binding and dimerization domain protein [Phycisphaerae bacterium]|nr:iron dependent repressor, metal binding and dimerization domain protein [Phycisphaerae bacterium]
MTPWYVMAFLLASLGVVFWPRRGLRARWRVSQALARRIRREDALKHILKCEANGRMATLNSLAGSLQITTSDAAQLLKEMGEHDLLTFEGGKLHLRPTGRTMGLHIIRAHRLWESYLAEQTGLAEVEWHSRAEEKEHLLTPEEADQLAARLGHPTLDPHGDAIPEADGVLEGDAGRSLNSVEPNTPVQITHVEDEPETIYRQLVAQGLRPGMRAFVIDKSPTHIRFWADGSENVLAPILAENVSVKPLQGFQTEDLVEEEFLSGLRPGERTRVIGLSAACRGQERRRLLDLGFVAGTPVEVDMVSPAGDPTAYRLRGSVVALRREQANLIRTSSKEVVTS